MQRQTNKIHHNEKGYTTFKFINQHIIGHYLGLPLLVGIYTNRIVFCPERIGIFPGKTGNEIGELKGSPFCFIPFSNKIGIVRFEKLEGLEQSDDENIIYQMFGDRGLVRIYVPFGRMTDGLLCFNAKLLNKLKSCFCLFEILITIFVADFVVKKKACPD